MKIKSRIQIVDFGVAMWLDKAGGTIPAFCIRKDVYEVHETQTVNVGFDIRYSSNPISQTCRLFGILMAKLLLFGSEVDDDIFDFKSNSILKAINCEYPSWRKLMDLCFQPPRHLTADHVLVIISSINREIYSVNLIPPPKSTESKSTEVDDTVTIY
jgi:hypothetical protein